MFKKALDYINQPAESSFRTVNLSPGHPIATIVPKKEPLWLSILLDMRDGPVAVLTEAVDSIREQIRRCTMEQLQKNQEATIIAKLEHR